MSPADAADLVSAMRAADDRRAFDETMRTRVRANWERERIPYDLLIAAAEALGEDISEQAASILADARASLAALEGDISGGRLPVVRAGRTP